jgi:uncharacterized protein YoxC
MTMTPKEAKLFKDLEEIRNTLETLVDDETVKTMPKAIKDLTNQFDAILQDIEDGEYREESEENEESDERNKI